MLLRIIDLSLKSGLELNFDWLVEEFLSRVFAPSFHVITAFRCLYYMKEPVLISKFCPDNKLNINQRPLRNQQFYLLLIGNDNFWYWHYLMHTYLASLCNHLLDHRLNSSKTSVASLISVRVIITIFIIFLLVVVLICRLNFWSFTYDIWAAVFATEGRTLTHRCSIFAAITDAFRLTSSTHVWSLIRSWVSFALMVTCSLS